MVCCCCCCCVWTAKIMKHIYIEHSQHIDSSTYICWHSGIRAKCKRRADGPIHMWNFARHSNHNKNAMRVAPFPPCTAASTAYCSCNALELPIHIRRTEETCFGAVKNRNGFFVIGCQVRLWLPFDCRSCANGLVQIYSHRIENSERNRHILCESFALQRQPTNAIDIKTRQTF